MTTIRLLQVGFLFKIHEFSKEFRKILLLRADAPPFFILPVKNRAAIKCEGTGIVGNGCYRNRYYGGPERQNMGVMMKAAGFLIDAYKKTAL